MRECIGSYYLLATCKQMCYAVMSAVGFETEILCIAVCWSHHWNNAALYYYFKYFMVIGITVENPYKNLIIIIPSITSSKYLMRYLRLVDVML